ncbi:MAG TPA: GWxTD domain-containing protein, partial [Gracilimonas sp.]|nr:GWxTD domain-containing protein [Gracilimonas sp.]
MEDIKRGAGYNYQPGFPELRMEVSGLINENGQPILQIAGSIPHNSLVFKTSEEGLSAAANISFEITNKTTGTIETFNCPAIISKDAESSVFDDKLFLFEHEFEVAPGNYVVHVTVVDQSSKKTITLSAEAYLPDVDNKISNITNIQILAKYDENNKNFFPVTTYDVTTNSDSLKFIFQVTNNNPDEPITFQTQLIKFKSDTTVALPMSFPNPSPSNIKYKGIDYDEFEVIQSS